MIRQSISRGGADDDSGDRSWRPRPAQPSIIPRQQVVAQPAAMATVVQPSTFRGLIQRGFFYKAVLKGTSPDIDENGMEVVPARLAMATRIQMANLPPLKVPAERGEYVRVRVSYIEDVSNLYVQLENNGPIIEGITLKINSVNYAECRTPIRNPETGTVVVAKFHLDSCYYRASVMTKNGMTSIKVFFLDYGNCEDVGVNDVFGLGDEELRAIPPQAIRVHLKDVRGTTMTKKQFTELVEDRDVAIQINAPEPDGKAFSAKVVVIDENETEVDIAEVLRNERPPPARHGDGPVSNMRSEREFGPRPSFAMSNGGFEKSAQQSAFVGSRSGGSFGRSAPHSEGERFGNASGENFSGDGYSPSNRTRNFGDGRGDRQFGGLYSDSLPQSQFGSSFQSRGSSTGWRRGDAERESEKRFGPSAGCFNCGKDGHRAADCPEPKRERSIRGGEARECFKCRKTGHISRDCPNEASDTQFSRSGGSRFGSGSGSSKFGGDSGSRFGGGGGSRFAGDGGNRSSEEGSGNFGGSGGFVRSSSDSQGQGFGAFDKSSSGGFGSKSGWGANTDNRFGFHPQGTGGEDGLKQTNSFKSGASDDNKETQPGGPKSGSGFNPFGVPVSKLRREEPSPQNEAEVGNEQRKEENKTEITAEGSAEEKAFVRFGSKRQEKPMENAQQPRLRETLRFIGPAELGGVSLGDIVEGFRSDGLVDSDPTSFFVQLSRDESIIDGLRLVELPPQAKKLDSVDVHSVCAALYYEQYYRAEVIGKSGNGKYHVLFVDYGNTDEVSVDNLFAIDSSFPDSFRCPNRFAFQCRLTSVVPSGGAEKFDEDARKAFSEITGEDVSLRITFLEKSCKGIFEVAIVLEDGRDVSDILFERGYAVPMWDVHVPSIKIYETIELTRSDDTEYPNDIFTARVNDDESTLAVITDNIKCGKRPSMARVGSAVFGMYEGCAYRAEIVATEMTENGEEKCRICFVDYGNEEICSIEELSVVDRDEQCEVVVFTPRKGLRCRIEGVRPCGDGKDEETGRWSSLVLTHLVTILAPGLPCKAMLGSPESSGIFPVKIVIEDDLEFADSVGKANAAEESSGNEDATLNSESMKKGKSEYRKGKKEDLAKYLLKMGLAEQDTQPADYPVMNVLRGGNRQLEITVLRIEDGLLHVRPKNFDELFEKIKQTLTTATLSPVECGAKTGFISFDGEFWRVKVLADPEKEEPLWTEDEGDADEEDGSLKSKIKVKKVARTPRKFWLVDDGRILGEAEALGENGRLLGINLSGDDDEFFARTCHRLVFSLRLKDLIIPDDMSKSIMDFVKGNVVKAIIYSQNKEGMLTATDILMPDGTSLVKYFFGEAAIAEDSFAANAMSQQEVTGFTQSGLTGSDASGCQPSSSISAISFSSYSFDSQEQPDKSFKLVIESDNKSFLPQERKISVGSGSDSCELTDDEDDDKKEKETKEHSQPILQSHRVLFGTSSTVAENISLPDGRKTKGGEKFRLVGEEQSRKIGVKPSELISVIESGVFDDDLVTDEVSAVEAIGNALLDRLEAIERSNNEGKFEEGAQEDKKEELLHSTVELVEEE